MSRSLDSLKQILSRNAAARAAFAILAMLYLVALFAPLLSPYDPDDESRSHSWAPPSRIRFDGLRPYVHPVSFTFDDQARRVYVEDTAVRARLALFVDGHLLGLRQEPSSSSSAQARLYLLGADSRGRDLLSRLLSGSRISLTIGVVGVTISTIIALIVGGIAGFAGGKVDWSLMRLCEIVMLVPGFYLLMLLRAALPLDWDSRIVYASIVLILSFIGWAGLARVVRGLVLSIRERDHVVASRALGVPAWKILVRHVLPHTWGFLVIQATLSIPGYIVAESGLSLLGLGIQDPQTSWGNLLQEAMSIAEIRLHPWSLLPGAFLFLAVLSWNLAGDALRDAFDPRGDE
jgi:peptide/nickel transport system permease protein